MDNLRYGIAWDDSLLTGNAQVDAQHKKIFELLSSLVASCEEGSSNEKLHETLMFLVNYAVQHFIDEEALQIEYGYPDYKNHRQTHEDFKVTVLELVQRFKDSGSSIELNNDVHKILVRWLVKHIQIEDKKIGAHIRKKTGK